MRTYNKNRTYWPTVDYWTTIAYWTTYSMLITHKHSSPEAASPYIFLMYFRCCYISYTRTILTFPPTMYDITTLSLNINSRVYC